MTAALDLRSDEIAAQAFTVVCRGRKMVFYIHRPTSNLTVGSVPKKLVRFALPFMFSTLLQTAYSMVDMIVVGQFVGSKGLSAVSIASQLMWLTTALCMGFTNAGQIIVSQLIGAGRRQDLKKTIGTVTWSALMIGSLSFVPSS